MANNVKKGPEGQVSKKIVGPDGVSRIGRFTDEQKIADRSNEEQNSKRIQNARLQKMKYQGRC